MNNRIHLSVSVTGEATHAELTLPTDEVATLYCLARGYVALARMFAQRSELHVVAGTMQTCQRALWAAEAALAEVGLQIEPAPDRPMGKPSEGR